MFYLKLKTLVSCTVLGLLLALPAAAHNTSAPLDAASQHVSDMLIAAAVVSLLGIAAYYGLAALVTYYERRRHLALDEKGVRAGTLLATAGVVVLLWRLAAPAPVAVASTGAHWDTPQHGGQTQSVGDNHLEAVVRPNRSVSLYVMGIAETIPFPLTTQTLWAKVQGVRAEDASTPLHAAPLSGDPKGQSSVFVGEVPPALADKPVLLAVTVPLSGQEQQVRFDLDPAHGPSAAPAHDTAATRVVALPVTAADRALFLKPGGAYTAADIAANGGLTPDQKFQGMMANHHLNPKKGTYTCPITKTQANSKFAWVVGGKKYLFCCPPCVSEFVKQAKTNPKSIKPPDAYIQM